MALTDTEPLHSDIIGQYMYARHFPLLRNKKTHMDGQIKCPHLQKIYSTMNWGQRKASLLVRKPE